MTFLSGQHTENQSGFFFYKYHFRILVATSNSSGKDKSRGREWTASWKKSRYLPKTCCILTIRKIVGSALRAWRSGKSRQNGAAQREPRYVRVSFAWKVTCRLRFSRFRRAINVLGVSAYRFVLGRSNFSQCARRIPPIDLVRGFRLNSAARRIISRIRSPQDEPPRWLEVSDYREEEPRVKVALPSLRSAIVLLNFDSLIPQPTITTIIIPRQDCQQRSYIFAIPSDVDLSLRS